MEPGELQPAGWEPSLVDRSLRWALLSLELLEETSTTSGWRAAADVMAQARSYYELDDALEHAECVNVNFRLREPEANSAAGATLLHHVVALCAMDFRPLDAALAHECEPRRARVLPPLRSRPRSPPARAPVTSPALLLPALGLEVRARAARARRRPARARRRRPLARRLRRALQRLAAPRPALRGERSAAVRVRLRYRRPRVPVNLRVHVHSAPPRWAAYVYCPRST